MIDEREIVRSAAEALTPPDPSFERLLRRRDHVQRTQKVRAGVLGVAIAIAVGWLGVNAFPSGPTPADDRSEELGIFAPVSERIVYVNDEIDRGYDPGLWAVDPLGPSDKTEGVHVGEYVTSTLVKLDLEGATPLGWSNDGTELLFSRPDAASAESLFPEDNLYILHADGSETRLNRDPMMFGGAAISPDGTRVVFAAWGDDLGMYVVDVGGGRPVRLPLPRTEGIVADPSFSPDGTQIAYVDSGESENHLWVMDADGDNAREILADEPSLVGGAGSLQWSPATNRLAAQGRHSDGTNAIYTFAPDGSDFRQVITGGLSPYWSPDGSQIAYTIECEVSDTSCGGLAIADADGSNVRAFGFGASGPWHPGTGRPTWDDAPKVRGWPDTTRNPPGVYSWDGSRCASQSCNMGFMHNAYGSGDVEVRIEQLPEEGIIDGATTVTVAGHDAIYRRNAQREEWIVDIEGTTIAIRLNVRPGASQADVDDAHGIIGSMRTEPRGNDLGFRLVFTLTTNDWDSG